MKKFLLLLLSLFLLTNSAIAETVKFAQVTDVHTTKDNINYVKQFVEDINKRNDIDFVVFTGDNIDKPHIQDLDLFLNEIKNINVKTYVTLGNHDVFKSQHLDKQLYMKTVRNALGSYHSDKPNYVFKDKGIVFVVMDGVKEVIPGSNGYFKDSELAWLDKTLTKYTNNKVVIIQHFPLLPCRTADHSIYKLDNYLKVLKKHSNVIGVISGHYHENREEYKYGVYNIITAKFNNNQYYKIIEIDNKSNMIYTHLAEPENFEI